MVLYIGNEVKLKKSKMKKIITLKILFLNDIRVGPIAERIYYMVEFPFKLLSLNDIRYVGQLVTGVYCVVEGMHDAVEANICVNPIIKNMFITASVASLISGISMLGAFGLRRTFCVDSLTMLGCFGIIFRTVARYAITTKALDDFDFD